MFNYESSCDWEQGISFGFLMHTSMLVFPMPWSGTVNCRSSEWSLKYHVGCDIFVNSLILMFCGH